MINGNGLCEFLRIAGVYFKGQRMKLTNTEKGFLVIMALGIILTLANIVYFTQKIKEEGGIRKITVEVGKDIKSIAKEINEEVTKK